jgi:signal transduction histidine kinase
MQTLTRSLYTKVFLMFFASMLTLYVFNQIMVLAVGNSEVRQIFAERQLAQNIEWSKRSVLSKDDSELHLELMQAMRTAKPQEIIVVSHPLGQVPTEMGNDFLLPAGMEPTRITSQPTGKHFPLITDAVIDANGRQWNATRLIAPDRVVTALVDQSVNQRSLDEFMSYRERMARQIMPLTVLISLVCGILICRRVLSPTKRIQKSLRSIDYKDLSQRISNASEDKEFNEFIETINSMLARLERGFQQASRFSSDAAHELRTPLTILRGYVERAIQQAPSARLQVQLRMISEEIDRLVSITDKLLLLAQADAGRLSMELEPVNVSEMLEAMRMDVTMLEPALELRGKIEGGLVLQTDRALFQQMLNNLFSNAVKYNEDGGWIEISAWRDAGHLKIRFSNSGQVPDHNFEKKAFERFSRADLSRSRRIDGVGLGLSLCKEIALANAGTLEFRIYDQQEVRVEFSAPLRDPASLRLEPAMQT